MEPLPLQIPPESLAALSPEKAGELNSLGPLLEAYGQHAASRARNARILWAGIGVGLLGLLVAVLAAFFPEKRPGDRLRMIVLGVPFGGFFLIACGWRLLQLRRCRGVRVLVFAEGFARVNGGDLVICRWDEIEEVEGWMKAYHAEEVRVGRRLIISLKTAGGRLRFDTAREHLTNLDDLYHRISEETARRLCPRLLAAAEAGETVTFGRLGLSRRGVHCGDRMLPWVDVEGVTGLDAIRVRRRDAGRFDWWGRQAFLVPNALVFLGLAEHYLREGRG